MTWWATDGGRERRGGEDERAMERDYPYMNSKPNIN